jgi:hypothetical protein
VTQHSHPNKSICRSSMSCLLKRETGSEPAWAAGSITFCCWTVYEPAIVRMQRVIDWCRPARYALRQVLLRFLVARAGSTTPQTASRYPATTQTTLDLCASIVTSGRQQVHKHTTVSVCWAATSGTKAQQMRPNNFFTCQPPGDPAASGCIHALPYPCKTSLWQHRTPDGNVCCPGTAPRRCRVVLQEA